MDAADAAAWAEALERAAARMRAGEIATTPKPRPTIIPEDLSGDGIRQANSGLTPEFVDEFIAFLRRGGFTFLFVRLN